MSGDTDLRVTVHIDGGAKGNPGPAAAAFVIAVQGDDDVLHESGIFLGKATNNVAEYRGLLAGMEAAAALGAREAEIVSDSELLVRQMNGVYRVRNAGLKPLFEKAQGLRERFTKCAFRHVRREYNTRADRLVKRAINLRRDVAGIDD